MIVDGGNLQEAPAGEPILIACARIVYAHSIARRADTHVYARIQHLFEHRFQRPRGAWRDYLSLLVTRPAGGPADKPGFLLWRTTLRWQRAVTATLAPLGLTHVQFVLLACAWWLNTQGQIPSQFAIASNASTDVKMTSEVLRKLEAKGLVQRTVDPLDSRARAVTVTPAGADLAQRAIAVVEAFDAEFFAGAPAPFVAYLHQLAELPAEPKADAEQPQPH
jgi:DNA-binding MarR family transcriptional regulator